MSHHDTAIMDIEDGIDAILDQVAETGIPVTVMRKGKTITISCAMNDSKLDRLEEHPGFLQVDPEDIVHIDWSGKENMESLNRITIDPMVMGGKPCIRGMRVTVGTIVGLIACGKTIEDILGEYPYLERNDVMEALSYAAWRAEERELEVTAG